MRNAPEVVREVDAFALGECRVNRRALRSSFTNRAFGFAVANGSVPSITILISRPARRSRTGRDRSSVLVVGSLWGCITTIEERGLWRATARHCARALPPRRR